MSAEGQKIRSPELQLLRHVDSARAPKNGAPTLCSLSAANKSADITLDQSMAYVEKLRLQAPKMAVLANEKAPFSAIFPLCIQGAGQRGTGEVKESANWARRSSLYSKRRFPAKTGVCRTAMRNKFGMIALPGQAQLFTAPGPAYEEAKTRFDALLATFEDLESLHR